MKKNNNKGYMLVEIILASALAMIVAYFVIELTIKLKNKNDDLLVKTLVSTDQAIIYNTIMSDVKENGLDSFSCDKIEIKNNKFVYNGELISFISDYADVDFDSSNKEYCNVSEGDLKLKIPISVSQLPDDNFDVLIGMVDGNSANVFCSLELTSDNKIVATTNYDGDIVYQGFDSSYEGDNVTTKTISSTGTYSYYIKVKNNRVGVCSIDVIDTTCPVNYNKNNDKTKCYRTDSGLVVTTITSCTCYTYSGTFSASLSYSTCYDTCYAGWGTELKSASSNTTSSCQNGGSYSGGTCYFNKPLECPEGYLNKANNNYCWKVVE